MTVETSCHISLLKIGCLFMFVYSFIVVNRNYCNLKDIDMSVSPIEKFIILTEDVALLRKMFMGKKTKLVKFVWFDKYFSNVFGANLNLRKMFFRSTCHHLFYYGRLLPL